MTRQQQAMHNKLAERVRILKASAQVLVDEAVTIERELQGLYPTASKKKTGKFQLSDEEKARLRAETYSRRHIKIDNPK